MKRFLFLLLLGAAAFGYYFPQRPLTYPPGILIASAPAQTLLANSAPIEHGPFHLRPLAEFEADARVLHRKSYGYDRAAKLVPVDLALGWGAMSDQAVLDQLKITQSMRFYWYEYQMPPPIAREEIIRQSTNVHIIPANRSLETSCRHLRSGALIHLRGELVEATGPEIGTWRSSLSRTDTGNGACELLLLEELRTILPNDSKSPAVLAAH